MSMVDVNAFWLYAAGYRENHWYLAGTYSVPSGCCLALVEPPYLPSLSVKLGEEFKRGPGP